MSFTVKTNGITIDVRNEGEYAVFLVREWQRPRHDGSIEYGCELTINGSYGALGYTWGAMGSPAHKFFDSENWDYFLGKLYMGNLSKFDFDETVKTMKKEVLEDRRKNWLDKGEAADLWEEIGDLEHTDSVDYFMSQTMGKEQLCERWDNVHFPLQTRVRDDAMRFWELLWPDFIKGLKQHAEQPDSEAFLADIGKKLQTQDNRITSDAIFVVEQKTSHVGGEGYNSERIVWVDTLNGISVHDENKIAELDTFFEKNADLPKNYDRVPMFDTWEFVTACFTEAAAEQYIKVNGHNLRAPRIFVRSGFRNAEWIRLREIFIAKANQK